MAIEKMLGIVGDALQAVGEFLVDAQGVVSSWGALTVALVALVVALVTLLHERQQATLQGLDFRITPRAVDVPLPVSVGADGQRSSGSVTSTQLVVGIHAVGPGARYDVSLRVWGPKKGVEVVQLSRARELWGPGDPPMIVVLQRPGGVADAEMSTSTATWTAKDVMVGLTWAVPGWPRGGLRDRAFRVHIAAPGKAAKDPWSGKYEKWSPKHDRWVPYCPRERGSQFVKEITIGLHCSSQGFGKQDLAAVEESEQAVIDEQHDQQVREMQQLAMERVMNRPA